MENQKLQQQDPAVAAIIAREEQRQASELELIASENYASSAVRSALASVLTNKYSEGYSGKRYYGGNYNVDEIENLAIERAKKLFAAEHVNVQPLSGSPANAAVYMAFLEPGDKVLGLRLDHGGHLSHGHSVNFSGRLYNFVQYGVSAETGRIDMEEVRRLAVAEKPKMIVAGFSAYSREIDWAGFKAIADEIGAYTFADIAHIAGLIAGRQLTNPVPLFDVVSTTTHKTLRGPRGAIIMCREQYAKQIDRAVFPGMQGGPLMHVIAAKAVAFKVAMQPEFKAYQQQIVANSTLLAQKLAQRGFRVVSGGTDNHMVLVDLTSKKITGKEAQVLLERVNITINKNLIPYDPLPPAQASGIRLGTPAITSRGIKEPQIEIIARLIDDAIAHRTDEAGLAKVKQEVAVITKEFPLYPKQGI